MQIWLKNARHFKAIVQDNPLIYEDHHLDIEDSTRAGKCLYLSCPMGGFTWSCSFTLAAFKSGSRAVHQRSLVPFGFFGLFFKKGNLLLLLAHATGHVGIYFPDPRSICVPCEVEAQSPNPLDHQRIPCNLICTQNQVCINEHVF